MLWKVQGSAVAARRLVVGPAEQAPGPAFEDRLVDRILDGAGAEPGQLPLVGSPTA